MKLEPKGTRVTYGRWRTATLLVALLLATLIPGVAGDVTAQERERPMPRLDERLGPETAERLRGITRRATQGGVPADLLRRKVNEGISKGVTGPRLERAIEDYAGRLVDARRLAGPDVGPDVLVAAAEAAERGVTSSRIRRFLTTNRNPLRAVVGLRVLGDLVELGVPEAEASRGVSAALDRGMRGERLLAMSAAVRRRAAAGADPTAALRAEIDRRP